jgi:hypothetical protein
MTEQLFPSEQIDLQSQQVDPVVQVPNQDPPYKKKVYDILSTNFDDFKLTEDDFYKKLASDKTYAGKVHKVLIDNFEDFTKPADKFVADITFEEPVKKKDGTQNLGFPQYKFPEFGKPSSPLLFPLIGENNQLQPQGAPNVEESFGGAPLVKIDTSVDPFQLAQKTTKWETGKDDPYSVELKKRGFGDDWTDAMKDLPKGYENHNYYGTEQFKKAYNENPVAFGRMAASLKWQHSLLGWMTEKAREIKATDLKNVTNQQDVRYNMLNDEAVKSIMGEFDEIKQLQAPGATREEKKAAVGKIIEAINKYIPNKDEREAAIANVKVDHAIDFGDLDEYRNFYKKQGTPEANGLTDYEQVGYDYLKYTDPGQAEYYKRVLMGIQGQELDNTQLRALEKNKNDLHKLGINLVYANAKEDLDNLVAKAKNNGGVLSDAEFAKAQELERHIASSTLESNIIDAQVKNTNEDFELEAAAQQAAGQRFSTPRTIGNIAFNSFANTGAGIIHYAKSLFQSPEASNADLLSAQGMDMYSSPYVNLNADKSLYNNSKLVISPDLQNKIDAALLRDIPQEEKVDEVKRLMSSNRDKWRTIKTEGTFNITPLSVVSSVSRLGAEIAPYIILEASSGGGATEGLVSKLAKTWAAVAVTSYQSLVQNAMRNKDPHPEDTALLNITINTLAFTAGGIPSKIRAKAGTNTAVGKLINQMDDATILKAIEKRPQVLTDYLLQYGKKVGSAIVSSGKSAASMQGALAGAEILKGADVNSDFAKEQIAQYLNFTLFGAVGLSFKKTPDIKTESREALYLASQNPESLIRFTKNQIKEGKLTSQQGEQVINNIKGAKQVYDNLPKTDAKGNPLTDAQKSNLMFLSIQESHLENKLDKGSKKDQDATAKKLAEVQDEKDAINSGTLTENLSQMFKANADERDNRISELESIISDHDAVFQEKGRGPLSVEARRNLAKELEDLKTQKQADIESGGKIPFTDLGNKPEIVPTEEVQVTEEVVPTEEVQVTEETGKAPETKEQSVDKLIKIFVPKIDDPNFEITNWDKNLVNQIKNNPIQFIDDLLDLNKRELEGNPQFPNAEFLNNLTKKLEDVKQSYLNAEKAEGKQEVVSNEVKAEVKPAKEPVIVVHGTGDNGFVLEHNEGIDKKDIARPEDVRDVTVSQNNLTIEEKNELNKTGSLVKENEALDNGDKKVSIFTKHSDLFGRAGGSRFDIVIPENNSSTAEGVKDVLDKLYDENIIKNIGGSEYIKEAVKRVKDYIDSNKVEPAKEKSVKSAEGEKVKSERAGGVEPELPKGGTNIVTETGLTEKERQDKIEERKKQTKITDEVDKRNKLVLDTKSFYTRNKRQRNSSEGLRELNKLRIRARDLGLEIDDRLESVIKKTGARRTKIKYNAKAEGDATIENGKTLYERNRNTQEVFREMQDKGHILDFKDEFGTRLSDAQIDATIQDIMDGVPSKRANRYLDQLEEAIKKDEFPIYDKAFGEFNPGYEELMNLEKEVVGEPMDEAALNKFLDEESKLTIEEDQQLTDNIENLLHEYETEPETRVEEEIQQPELAAKEGVPSETEPIAENAEAGKPGEAQNYNDLTKNAKRRIINSKFDEIIKELKIEKIC